MKKRSYFHRNFLTHFLSHASSSFFSSGPVDKPSAHKFVHFLASFTSTCIIQSLENENILTVKIFQTTVFGGPGTWQQCCCVYILAAGPPPITEEDVKRMQEMFPSIDADVIKSVLEAARGNQEQAVSNLLSMTAD